MNTHRIALAQALLVLFAWSFVKAEGYKSYQECRTCHSDIFKLWNNSLHAHSYDNSSFQAVFTSVLLDKGKETGGKCLRCHAPLTQITGDTDFKSPSAMEGVSCWFCHSVSSVNKEAHKNDYYQIDTTGVIYGPFETTESIAHPTRQSKLHLTADLCVGCHEYTNDNGVNILGTFSEWQDSPYQQEDIHCQNCHMPIMADLSVVNGRESPGYYVTAHEFQGGHSKINLAHAVKMVTSAERNGNQLKVTVEITNAESGHRLPTGVPIRKLVLQVSLRNEYFVDISVARKTYRKVLVDKFGTIIENAPGMFLEATGIYSDNRIRPTETRVENFVFDLPDHFKDFTIETELNYEYTVPSLKEELVRIRMARNSIRKDDIK